MSKPLTIRLRRIHLSKRACICTLLGTLLPLFLLCIGIMKQVGEIPLFLLLLLSVIIPSFLYLRNSYSLYVLPSTKELFLQSFFGTRHPIMKKDIDVIAKKHLKTYMTIDGHNYSFFHNHKNNQTLHMLTEDFLSGTSDISADELSIPARSLPPIQDTLPADHRHGLTLVYLRRLLILFVVLTGILLIANEEFHSHALLFISIMILLSISIHIIDCLLISKEFDAIFRHGHVLRGKILSFEHQNGRRGFPYFEFIDQDGPHKAISLLPMMISKKEKAGFLNASYNIWYAPEESAYVLYGEEEPEPVPAHYFSFTVISQMCIALVFLMILLFVGSPLDPTSNNIMSPWTESYLPSDYSQNEVDSDTVQWICTSYAIPTMALGRTPAIIGGIDPKNEFLITQLRNHLQYAFGVSSRKSAIQCLNTILEQGERTSYHELVTKLEKQNLFDLSRNEYLEKVSFYHEDFRYLAVYDTYHENGTVGIDAFDYVEALRLLGEFYVCRYISLEECLTHSLPIAKKLQSEFTSWKSLGQSYLYGYQYTKKIATNEVRIEYEHMNYCLDQLLLEQNSSTAISYDIPLVDTWSR